MKDYNKTLWEDNITLVDARKLNNIEEQVDSITDKLSEVESNLNKNIEAVEQACTAITGEKFNTIDERIDLEIDRLNKKIEVSMLQQEDKENHTIDNSVDGMTTDMIIKGRTLQNLLNQEGYYINPNGSQQYFHSRKYKNLFKAGKYTLKNITGNALIWDISRKDNDEWIKSIKSNKSIVIELEEGQYVRNIQALTINGWVLDESTRKILEHNVVILEGDRLDIINSIDYFEGIKSFGQKEDKINILSHGENLLDIKNITNGGSDINTTVQNDKVIITSLDNSRNWMSSYIVYDLKANTDYSFKYNAIGSGFIKANIRDFYNDSITYTNDIAPDYFRTFRVSKDVKVKIRFYITGSTGGSFKNEYYNIQLKEGSQDTPYKSYQQDKKDILVKEPLRSIGDFSDVMYENNKKIKILRNIFIATLNGQEDIFVNNATPNQNNTMAFAIKNICKPSSPLICDKFSYVKTTSFDSRDVESITTGGTDMYSLMIRINRNKLETQNVAGFRKWLQANNIITYCVRNTPTTEIVENYENINLKTYDERTYVSFENTLSGISSFKAPIDTKETLSTLKKENENIKTILNSILESLNKK